MTKVEYRKCEMLMEEAIREATDSNANYEEHVCLRKKGKRVDARCSQRLADQEIGYAEGINQAFAVLGFKHDRMKDLFDLL